MAVSARPELKPTRVRTILRLRNDFQRKRGGRPTPTELTALWGGGALATIGIGLRILSGREADWFDTPTVPAAWMVAASLFVVGVSLHVLRALGPLGTDAATTYWLVSTPLTRDQLLRSRFLAGSAVSSVAGVVIARALVSLVDSSAWWPYAATGAAVGVGTFSIGVLGQVNPRVRTLSRWSEFVLVGVGLLVVLTGVVVNVLPVVAVCIVLAIALWLIAFRLLGQTRRSALTAGADTVAAGSAAVSLLDASIVTASVEYNILRRRGSVRSRGLPVGRVQAMAMADVLRHTRNLWAVILLGLALLVSITAPTMFSPPAGSIVVLVVTYIGVLAASTGLRDVAQSGALRFALGATDKSIYLAHCVAPLTAVSIMWLVIAVSSTWLAGAIIAVAVAMAVYRKRMSPLSENEGLNLITTFGVIPVDLIRQRLRGPDVLLLAALLLLWI